MARRLVNVRLDEERLGKVRKLRDSGVAVSDVLREAIDQRYRDLKASRSGRDVRAIMARIFEEYPDPPDVAPLPYNVHDRRQARSAILRKLRRRR